MSAKTVFISYSHDSPEHSERVRTFAISLRNHGVDVELDQFHIDEIIDWPRWCNEQTSHANSDFVLCVCTEGYYKRIEGKVPPESGKGVYWEGTLLDDEIYDAKGNSRLIPLLFGDEPETSIPRFLRGWTFCRLYDFVLDDDGYKHVLRILTSQARFAKNPVGTVPILTEQPLPPRTNSDVISQRPPLHHQGPDKYLAGRSEANPDSSMNSALVIGIEFVADGPFAEFDQAQWEAALRELMGKDIRKVRIASIRKGSTVVRILGDPEVIARAVEKLRRSTQDAEGFQLSTGSTSYAGVLGSRGAERIFGRSEELAHLDTIWAEQKAHVLTVVGFGGIGKSHLIAHWLQRLAADGWRGAERVFDWSFYSQGVREQSAVSADAFISSALVFFGDAVMAQSAASAWDKGARLAHLVAQERTLLVLDGVEPLQHPAGPLAGELKDPALATFLKRLAQRNLGLCIVTTREAVTDLESFQNTTAPAWLLESLSEEAGSALLKGLLEPVKPKDRRQVKSTDAERREIVRAVKGHALTLQLLGGFIQGALGDVRKWREIDFTAADARLQGGYAFKTLSAYERWLAAGGEVGSRQLAILRLLGLFDRPADAARLNALRKEPAIPNLTEPLIGLSEEAWSAAVSTLEDFGLVSRTGGDRLETQNAELETGLDAHPLIREYFGQQVREQNPGGWRAAHRRLYEHLCRTTKDKSEPTLKDLQPLYQAVAHGCYAAMQQEACEEVYIDRILRGTGSDGFYSTRKLGAFGADLGAVACFFEEPWSRPSASLTEANQLWLLNQAAFYLRAFGRLTEALEPMRARLEICIKQEISNSAATIASNLSELELMLGDVAAAVRDAELSVTYSDRSGDMFQRMSKRTTLADALHQAGSWAGAEASFREAEAMQGANQPDYPLLYSIWGFRYCDLLLVAAERAAWRKIPEVSDKRKRDTALEAANDDLEVSRARSPFRPVDPLNSCNAVFRRAAQTLQMARKNNLSLLTVALDNLTMGRAAFYAFTLDTPSFPISTVIAHITAAVDGLRRAGQQDDLPLGLLTRAWLRFLTGVRLGPESAQADLDEAWEIAERGPMRLFMADIHLYRARLFHGVKPYPWTSPQEDLAAARKLIEQCGYWRRKEELEDAEEAAKNW